MKRLAMSWMVCGIAALTVPALTAEEPAPAAAKPDQIQVLYKAGKAAAKAKDWKTASAKWEEALKIDPQSWEILNHYAWFLVDTVPSDLWNPDKALEMAAKANDLAGGKNMDILDTLAEIWFQKKDFVKAVEFSKQSLEPGLQGHSKPEDLRKQLAKFEKALADSKASAPAGR